MFPLIVRWKLDLDPWESWVFTWLKTARVLTHIWGNKKALFHEEIINRILDKDYLVDIQESTHSFLSANTVTNGQPMTLLPNYIY